MFTKRKQGFTIIELLVVISVILILAAIITPAVHKAKAKAKRVQCLANIRQCGQTAIMYAQDYEDYLPYTGGVFDDWWDLPGIKSTKYLKDEVRHCPNQPELAAGGFYRYSIFEGSAGDINMTSLDAADPLLCDRPDAGDVWDDEDADMHEGEGGIVFYAIGNAAFVTSPDVPDANTNMTRLDE
jgi:prepilin-type N-terminal cleavage/methylation domain-containing protein